MDTNIGTMGLEGTYRASGCQRRWCPVNLFGLHVCWDEIQACLVVVPAWGFLRCAWRWWVGS